MRGLVYLLQYRGGNPLIYNKLKSVFNCFSSQPEIYRIIILYRFISLLIISVFYFIKQPGNTGELNMLYITCIVGSAMLLNYLYIKNKGNKKNILLIILIETCGNSILLIPSGGIESPYVWYSLNTILISSVELPVMFCWLNLAVYFIASASISVFLPAGNELNIFKAIFTEHNLFLSLILITAIVQLLSKYARKMQNTSDWLADTNQQLQLANTKLTASLDHIMELYQAVNLFSGQNSHQELVKLMVHYIQKITKAETVFFYGISDEDKSVIVQSEKDTSDLDNRLGTVESKVWEQVSQIGIPMKIELGNRDFKLILIHSSHMNYGVLGIDVTLDDINDDLTGFLSGMSAIALERFDQEQVNDRLIITEEQNRIANEIHDNVLQRLFSISCGIYNIRKKNNDTSADLDKELEIIRESVNSSMNELRSAIYDLSWNKNGADNFVSDIMKYIKQIKHMSNTEIDLKVKGSTELLISMQKKAMYRMICEGIGNAIRHGRATNICIDLNVDIEYTFLDIYDDGGGFDIEKMESEGHKGMGLSNIRLLVKLLKGSINIQSSPEKGTSLRISIPNTNQNIRGEKLI